MNEPLTDDWVDNTVDRICIQTKAGAGALMDARMVKEALRDASRIGAQKSTVLYVDKTRVDMAEVRAIQAARPNAKIVLLHHGAPELLSVQERVEVAHPTAPPPLASPRGESGE